MNTLTINTQPGYFKALWLAWLTMAVCVLEAIFSLWWGLRDESLTLFGFGLDSLIEVISAAGIVYMVMRIQRNPHSERAPFEVTALRVTGMALYMLAAGLTVMALNNIYFGNKPEATISGIIVSLASIAAMWFLIMQKVKVGTQLNSEPILADAECSRVCVYMSVVLLAASVMYALSGIGYVDSLGTLVLSYFSLKEGKESFDKANGKACSCED